MKKSFILLLAAMIVFASVSLAESGLSALSDDALMELYRRVAEEAENRNLLLGEKMPETSGGTVLYYVPEGGQYYHADQNCKTVHETCLPMKGSFTEAELRDEAYRDLQPCAVCGAPFRQEDPVLPASFREAVEDAGESAAVGGDIDYLSAVAEKDGKVLRFVTLLDDSAKKLYMDAMTAEDPGAAFEAFNAYAWSLPVSYTEEITAQPKEQAELDAQAGKTVGELLEEGYCLYGSGGGIGLPTVVDLSYGFYNYAFEADASFEEYLEHEEKEDLGSLKVKSGKRSGFSGIATNPDYLADGTYAPQVVPHITAEEAAHPAPVPPPEEYTRNARPLTAEEYSDLLTGKEDRYGRVYRIEGVVHQVLSQDPLSMILRTGEDGKTQPVVVECPEPLSLSGETGSRWRIYADVTSACYLLPVLTARYTIPEQP